MDSEFERRLAVGAQLACQLRTAVKDKLGASSLVAHHSKFLSRTAPWPTPSILGQLPVSQAGLDSTMHIRSA